MGLVGETPPPLPRRPICESIQALSSLFHRGIGISFGPVEAVTVYQVESYGGRLNHASAVFV